MTRTYIAKRLLEHGPLSVAAFLEITGWPHRTALRTLQQLADTGVAARIAVPHARGYVYGLAK